MTAKLSDLEAACHRIAKEGGHPPSWKTIRRINRELRQLRAEKEATIRDLVLKAKITTVDKYEGVMLAFAPVYTREVGTRLADEAPARFSIVVNPTVEGRREGHLHAAPDCQLKMDVVSRPFGGTGDSHYAVIPNMPGSWRWPKAPKSYKPRRGIVFEMT